MAGDVQHVVDAAGDPVVTVLVAAGAVTAEVHAFEGREVGLLEAVAIAKQGTCLARPGVDDHQVAFACAFLRCADVIDQRRLYAEERPRGGTGLQLGGARQRVIMKPPVSVCHQVSTIGHFALPILL